MVVKSGLTRETKLIALHIGIGLYKSHTGGKENVVLACRWEKVCACVCGSGERNVRAWMEWNERVIRVSKKRFGNHEWWQWWLSVCVCVYRRLDLLGGGQIGLTEVCSANDRARVAMRLMVHSKFIRKSLGEREREWGSASEQVNSLASKANQCLITRWTHWEARAKVSVSV